MSQEDKKLFTDKRWTEPPKATVIGRVETPEEEREKNKKRFREHLKKIGVLKEED